MLRHENMAEITKIFSEAINYIENMDRPTDSKLIGKPLSWSNLMLSGTATPYFKVLSAVLINIGFYFFEPGPRMFKLDCSKNAVKRHSKF